MIGKTIAHYEILDKLGEGGMGVVYKARDKHLDRFVAIKVLPAEKVANADRKARFVREAKSASALNHPNIVHIYDIAVESSIDFMAMEYVAGRTLDELIPRKGMRLNEALKVAVQVADALTAAHEAGIIHRDLKPGNIMVGDDGRVRVLDFGLAKLTESVPESDETKTVVVGDAPRTEEGTILGTASYMSPEQAEGRPVDARSDIFSFGSVLYEMITGRRAFQGDSSMSTLAAIIKEDPKPAREIAEELPRELERIVNRCLRKDAERRVQHMKDLRVELEELKEESDSGSLLGAPAVAESRRFSVLLPAAIVLSAVAVLSAVWLWFDRSAPAGPEAEMSIVPFTTYAGREDNPDFSPDGTQVAFDGNVEDANNTDIYVRMVGSDGLLRLTTDPALDDSPKWTPDGRSIAFLRWRSQAEGLDLMLIPSIGGPERKIAEIGGPLLRSFPPPYFDWAPDGTRLVVVDRPSDNDPVGLYLISTTGDEPRRVTSPQSDGTRLVDTGVSFSPDGRFLAFVGWTQAHITEIYSLELSEDLVPVGDPKQLTSSGNLNRQGLAWTADGREIIYRLQSGSLWRIPSDGSEEPRRLAIAGSQVGSHDIDPVGERLICSQSSSDADIWQVKLAGDRKGSDAGAPFIVSSRTENNPTYSPNGQRIAFTSGRSGANGIWACDADGENAAALFVPERGAAGTPRWSPDGKLIAFDSNQEGQWDIYLIRSDGGTPMALTRDASDDYVPSWSRDGKWVYFASTRTGRHEIWKSSADGNETVQVTRGGGHVAFESWESKHVYYTKRAGQTASLWRVPVDGGEEQQVLDAVWNRNFAVTEGGLYFVKPPTGTEQFLSIKRFDPNTEEVENVVSLEVAQDDPGRRVAIGLTVSPDQRSILYVQRQTTSDLMLVENFR